MGHLAQLAEFAGQYADPGDRLAAVLEAYALTCHDIAQQGHGTDLTALAHRGEHLAAAHRQLSQFVQDLITDAARSGRARGDIPPGELAAYCLSALAAAAGLPARAAVRRLTAVTLAGLRPPP